MQLTSAEERRLNSLLTLIGKKRRGAFGSDVAQTNFESRQFTDKLKLLLSLTTEFA